MVKSSRNCQDELTGVEVGCCTGDAVLFSTGVARGVFTSVVCDDGASVLSLSVVGAELGRTEGFLAGAVVPFCLPIPPASDGTRDGACVVPLLISGSVDVIGGGEGDNVKCIVGCEDSVGG